MWNLIFDQLDNNETLFLKLIFLKSFHFVQAISG